MRIPAIGLELAHPPLAEIWAQGTSILVEMQVMACKTLCLVWAFARLHEEVAERNPVNRQDTHAITPRSVLLLDPHQP